MKRCGRCDRVLSLTKFHRQGDGYQPWCRECKRAYAADYYRRNRAARVAYNARQRREASAWFLSLKEGRPCTDCGIVFHPAAMQWDHPPGVVKVAHVAEMYRGRRELVLAEIAKCEIVCANCHAVRTHERRRRGVGAGAADHHATYPGERGPRSSAG